MRAKALFYCLILSSCFNLYGRPVVQPQQATQLYDSISHLLFYRQLSNFRMKPNEKDKKSILKLYSLKDRSDDPVGYAKVQYLDAFLRYNEVSPDYARIDSLMNEASKVLVPDVYPEEYACILLIKGGIDLRHTYNYAASYRSLNEAISLFKRIGNDVYLAKSYVELGNLWMELREYASSLQAFQSAKKEYEKTIYKNNIYYTSLNEGALYFQQKKYEKALNILSDVLTYAENTQDTIFLISIYNNIGGDYAQIEDWKNSLYYFEKAYRLTETYKHTSLELKAHVISNLGNYYLNMNNYNRASEYLQRAFTQVSSSEQKLLELQINFSLSDLYRRIDNYRDAYKHLNRYLVLKDSIAIDGKLKEVQKLRFQEELRSQQQQLQIARQATNIKHTQLILTIVVTLFLLIIVILLFNHRKKLKEAENRQLCEQLKNEEMKNYLQQIEHDKEVEAKEREIATSKLLIAEKGNWMEQLLKTFQPYYEQNILPESMWKEMKRLTGINQKKDDEWQEFTLHFDKVHPDFFRKLKDICMDLTENELRICSYLRIGIRAKEIAEMLSVSHHSILTNRYRIKKKLNLGKDDSLDDFIRNI